MLINKICIVGGTGFVGCTLANHLVTRGYKLRILTRDREKNREQLILLPDLELIQTNIHDPEQLTRQFTGCDVVINLAGILNESGSNGAGFRSVHVTLTEKIIKACQANDIHRLLQMSSLNADTTHGSSHYLRSKGEAEDMVHGVKRMHVTSFRPSVIFGPGDKFFNRFARLLKLSPLCFPLACAHTRFAPVWVNDVANFMMKSLTNPDSYGQRYNLCGPKVYTFRELVEYTARCCGIKRVIVPLPDLLSRIQASMFDLFGFIFSMTGMEKPFSMDNYLSTKKDSICEINALELAGIVPTPLEAIVPGYLSGSGQCQQYSHFRQRARRR